MLACRLTVIRFEAERLWKVMSRHRTARGRVPREHSKYKSAKVGAVEKGRLRKHRMEKRPWHCHRPKKCHEDVEEQHRVERKDRSS